MFYKIRWNWTSSEEVLTVECPVPHAQSFSRWQCSSQKSITKLWLNLWRDFVVICQPPIRWINEFTSIAPFCWITAVCLEYGCLENGCLECFFVSKNRRSVISKLFDGCLEFCLENGCLENLHSKTSHLCIKIDSFLSVNNSFLSVNNSFLSEL